MRTVIHAAVCSSDGRFLRCFLAALLLATLSTVAAFAEESWLGKSVYWKPGAKATVGDVEVDIETVPFPALVKEEKGDLLRLDKAWVHRSDVIPRQDALEFFSEKIRQDPMNPEWWSRRGLIWPIVRRSKDNRIRNTDNFDNAMKDHAEAIRLDPKNARYLYHRGKSFQENQHWDQAIADFTAAIALDPRHVNSYRGRAAEWSFKRQPDKTIADYTEVLRFEPNDAAAYYNRGQAWSLKSSLVNKSSESAECRQKAIDDYTSAIKCDPSFVLAYANRAYSWNKNNELDQPIADITECIKLEPKNFKHYEYRGYLQSSRGHADEAIQDYTTVITLHPKSSEAFHRRGDERMKLGQLDQAIEDFTAAIKIDLQSGEALKAGWGRYGTAYGSRGIARQKKGEFENALHDFQEALKIAPADLKPLTSLAWLRATCPDDRFRNGKEAVDFATKSLSSCRECSGFDTLAAAYAETGDFANAVKWAEKSVESAPETHKQPIIERLSLYRSNKPYREVPSAGGR